MNSFRGFGMAWNFQTFFYDSSKDSRRAEADHVLIRLFDKPTHTPTHPSTQKTKIERKINERKRENKSEKKKGKTMNRFSTKAWCII